jgi:hypothetical protein
MWWWRKVRKADIPFEIRSLFEQIGESCVQLILTGGLTPRAPNFQKIYQSNQYVEYAEAWLTEKGDSRELHEQRLETVEWAILIFVVLGVFADFLDVILILVLKR